jgi:hypothetical protein
VFHGSGVNCHRFGQGLQGSDRIFRGWIGSSSVWTVFSGEWMRFSLDEIQIRIFNGASFTGSSDSLDASIY